MEHMGILLVRVYASRAQLPLEGATVAVTQKGTGGKEQLISLHTTDSSGMTVPIPIRAPGAEMSLTPQEEGGAFARCTVTVEYPGYGIQRVEGVQLFSGVETIQRIELIPLEEGQSSLQHREVRTIPPQDL